MSEPENFLARWSRRKRTAAEAAAPARPAAAPAAPVSPTAPTQLAEGARAPEDRTSAEALRSPAPAPGKAEPAFDLTRLPPLDSISANTDIRAFLQPGVPADLTRAALRRAWVADPGVRDFVGLAENAWDFNEPGAMTGFGPLEMTDEIRRQVVEMVGRSLGPERVGETGPTPPEAQGLPPAIESTTELAADTGAAPNREGPADDGTGQEDAVNKRDEIPAGDELSRPGKVLVATQHDPEATEDQQTIGRRSHGRALPE